MLAVSAAALLILGAIWFYQSGQTSKGNEIKIEQLQQENEIKNEVIETKNFQQKLISKPALSVDLAARDRWVLKLWEESAKTN